TSEVRDDLQRAKTFVKGDIGDVRYRKIKTSYELLDALEEVKLIREGDVEYLRVLMDAIERNDLELEVKRYMETSDVMRKKSAWPSLREGLFIGREVTINKIIHSINSGPHIKMVCVSGFPGMGKTRLSREVCLRIGLQRPNPFNTYFVELRGLMHIESIFFAIASKLGLNTKDYDPHVLYNYIREYEQGKKGHSNMTKYLRSNLHLLLRTFIHEIKAEQQKEVRDWCEQAKKRFVRYYMDEMGDISKRFDEDHTDAMRQKEDDRVNFLYLIELLKQRSGVEEDVQDVRGMERVLRLLVSAKERRSYYRKRADASKQEGNTRMYAEMRCREVVQLVQMGHKVTTLMPALNEVRYMLEHLPDIESSNVQISLATCYQCKGDVYYERMHYAKAEKWMLKALKLRQTYLGNHYSTINSLASLAATNLGLAFKDIEEVLPTGEVTQSCEFLPSKVYRALGFAEQALSIAGTKKHLDVPDIILNMASGWLYLQKHNKAIKLYEEALKLERDLQTGGFEATQVLLKNIAMCHFEMLR
ncbi:uncharacterized protein LOC144353453, partial [Saccoglossus kowalevskii]